MAASSKQWGFDAAGLEGHRRTAHEETAEGLAGSFAVTGHRILFAGHFHRWLAATPNGLLAWDGNGPIVLEPDQRHLVVVAAVCDGWCALFDTASNELVPCQL